MDIAGIGGANIDIHGKSVNAIVMRDSNPSSLHLSCGGVTRNILENLSHLGCKTTLISAVGEDAFGQMILKDCKENGIDTSGLTVLPNHRSSTYLSVMDDDGDMLVALNDMAIIKSMGAELIADNLSLIQNCKFCVCDGNLSPQALEKLLSSVTIPIFCDPVSTAWAKVLIPYAHRFYALKPNLMELEVLSGAPVTNEVTLQGAVDVLLKKGLTEIYVSLGKDGMFYKNNKGEFYHKKSLSAINIANATGAGDAAMAGIIYSSLHEMSYKEKIHFALACSVVALQGSSTINPQINTDLVYETIKEYII